MKARQALLIPALVSICALLAGCGDPGRAPSGGGHSHASAHGGTAVELGDHQYHLDFLAEPETGTLKAWVMDGHVENFVRVSLQTIPIQVAANGATNTLALNAQPNANTGETVGDTSLFQAQADWLKGVTKFSAVIPTLEIRGARFDDIRFEYSAGH